MGMGVAKPRSEAARAIEENFTGSYEPRSRRAAVSFNAPAHRERPKRSRSDLAESQAGRDAVARRVRACSVPWVPAVALSHLELVFPLALRR